MRVAVLGGGMAGLAAAHELVERGFRVDVYERKALGGKARSIPVAGTAAGGRKRLPGEHGFRFFPGFYHHVPDSMRRIPFKGNENGVWDNLIDAPETKSPRTEGRADGTVFGIAPDPNEARTPDGMRRLLLDAFHEDSLPPHELAYFVERVMVFVTSCDERRFGEWEYVSWWDFIKAEDKSDEYKKVLARGLTRAVVAAKERKASTRTIGNMGEAFVYNFQGRGNDGAPDRVLNAPTNEAWIKPWVKLLRSQGVRFHVGQRVEALRMRGGEVESARARRPARPPPHDRGGLVRQRDAGGAGAAAVVTGGAPQGRVARAHGRAVRRLDERDPVLPQQAVPRRPRPPHVHRRALGRDRAHPGPVLGGPRLPARLRQRPAGRLVLGRHLRLGHARDRLRQAGEGVQAEAGREGGLRADQAPPERQRRGHPHRRHGRLVAPRPGDQVASRGAGGTRTTSRCS